MKYMGSKARFVKEILSIILKDRKLGQWYVEPFAGGMNAICEVKGNRIANDKNYYLIEMWRGLVSGIKYPREIPKALYDVARDVYNGIETRFEHQMNMTDDMVGWIGWMGSANGRFFDGEMKITRNTIKGALKKMKQFGVISTPKSSGEDYSFFWVLNPLVSMKKEFLPISIRKLFDGFPITQYCIGEHNKFKRENKSKMV